jgi:hypothetical protein
MFCIHFKCQWSFHYHRWTQGNLPWHSFYKTVSLFIDTVVLVFSFCTFVTHTLSAESQTVNIILLLFKYILFTELINSLRCLYKKIIIIKPFSDWIPVSGGNTNLIRAQTLNAHWCQGFMRGYKSLTLDLGRRVRI